MSTKKIVSSLESRFTQPDNWHWSEFERARGRHLRYGLVMPDNPKALVVMLPGLSEFGEKYFETAREMLAQGYGFAVLDWVGQGRAMRYQHPHDPALTRRRHISENGFADDVLDLHHLITQELPQDLPRIMLAHSMGGHIGMRYLHDHPNIFSCAAMSAPFLGVNSTHWMPELLEIGIAKILKIFAPLKYVPGGEDFCLETRIAGADKFSSDPARGALHNYWSQFDPDQQVGNATNTWLHSAISSYHMINKPNYLREINTPIFMALGTQEQEVNNDAIIRAAQNLPSVSLIEITDARHEIIMERDDLRNQFFDGFDKLVLENI